MTETGGTRLERFSKPAWMLWCVLVLSLAASMYSFGQTNFPVQLEKNVSLVGELRHPALVESSGLTASRQHAGVFWTHNDDGEPFIFAMNRRGEHLGAFEVQGANLIDWEAISADDFGNLYLADIGTNGMERTHSAIHRVEEPDPQDEWGPAKVEQTWYIRFPGVREDCESFFVLNGYGYLVTKYPRARMISIYRFFLGSSTEYTLELVARVPRLVTVSDAALSPDKQRLALLTEEGVEVYFINGDPASISLEARADTEFDEPDMEGITFVPDGLLVTFDSRRDVLLFNSTQLTGAPEITEPLENKTAFVGSDVVFAVEATGFPAVSYTWFFNRRVIPGQTSSNLVLTNVTLANAGFYQVVVSNALGTARSTALLTVLERTVDVRITEVMSSEAPGNVAKADWWELTSFDTQPVNLGGWHFNDSNGGVTNGFRIPDGTTIQPGESIIFVEGLTPEQFRAWWGANNVPPGVQIITYSGTQLSFSALGDTLRLWTNETTDEDATYAEVTFGPADVGVSFGYDPDAEVFGEKSRVGVHGAFVAAAGSDIGSPGRIRNVAVPTVNVRITEVMSSEVPGTIPKADWWELTSFDTVPVDLSGWRFNDNSGDLADAFVIPAGIVIQPGESIIFVENLTAGEFLAWWGANNIAPSTQIITYSGLELSFSSAGDTLRLWTDEATNVGDIYTQVSFGVADEGVSFGYNPVTGQFGEKSQVGVNGAFVAAAGPEIGSPGKIRNVSVPTVDLRITEVMSSEILGGVPKADWWELTSFHSAAVDISGWRFNDNTGGLADAFVVPAGTTINPGESIIFVENLTPAEFLAWWGSGNIAPGTQIISYTGVELSFASDGDALRLWTDEAASDVDVFAAVSFGLADPGVSFGYDPATGQFGEKSRPGVNGAFVAANGPEIGSPGRISNPPVDTIDIRITEVMSSEAPGGVPKADWWELTSFDTEPIDLAGWRFNDNAGGLSNAFVIPAGVVIQPGSSIVFVENLTPEQFISWWGANNIAPGTQIVTYSGIELSFSAAGDNVRLWTDDAEEGSEPFTQVFFGAADVGVSFGFDPVTGVFGEKSRVGINGAVQAAAGPEIGSPGRIRSEPVDIIDLRITEVMSDPAVTTAEAADWWELTSFDTEAVDLSGWMFNDATGDFSDAVTIPAGVVIQPGESIVFVEDLSRDAFLNWWGPANFPPGVQIITYSGTDIGFSDNGDSVRLWTAGTSDTNAIFRRVDFGVAEEGVSFGYDPVAHVFGVKSQPGIHGAFVAATGPDVGSPGRIGGTASVQLQFTSEGVRIDINASGENSYAVEVSSDLSGEWSPTNEIIRSTNGASVLLEKPLDGVMRFYRVKKL